MLQQKTAPAQTVKVRVLRAFYFDRESTVVGRIVELPRAFGLEMIAANKAALVAEEPKAAVPVEPRGEVKAAPLREPVKKEK